ncbi:MAG: segregation/condensation protein A [Deltaproteobacteria bacterium]|nr:segregation/condensation protein A [Deltaproteobacteria bacterium]MBW2362222.1 segregation/condensation protein A [Deltaproteobacteria bacterium]
MTSPASLGVAPAGSPYAVKLAVFEGPLDLLLHLIRINEVEITDIPIARIGEQYLGYLDEMRDLDLDVVGEYLLMAATLAWIKSRMLLPQVSDEEGEETDPRAELVARLLEYQRFKEMAGELGERRLLGRDVFDAVAPGAEAPPDAEREIEVGLYELLAAFRQALAREGPSGTAHEVEVETVTVYDQMVVVMQKLGLRDTIEFDAVLVRADGRMPNRAVIVATFLGILELTRLAALRLYQGLDANNVSHGPIHLRRAEDADAVDWRERIAEIM